MTTADDLARVQDIILVDCYGEDEEYTAFLTVLDEEMGLPMAASLLGTLVTVIKLDYHDPARGLVAHCDGPTEADARAATRPRFSVPVPSLDPGLPDSTHDP